MVIFKLCLILCLCHFSMQKSSPTDDCYIAAVVEYKLNYDGNVTENLKQYVKIIEKAAAQDVDIIVFPEKTLTLNDRCVEVPINGLLKKYPVPADNPEKYDEILVEISQAAKDNSIYVVINLREYLDCRTPNKNDICPGEQEFRFNTDVVFDRNGAVIERAAQYHLLGEPELTPQMVYTDVSTFMTDFGVEFGTIISFDVFFTMPTAILVTEKNLTNIIMTSKWYSEMPFLTSIETQRAFEACDHINLLAAGANNWKYGNGGSGIYSGKSGALISFMREVSTYRLLVAKVPKTPGKLSMSYPGPIKADPAQLDGLRTFTDSSIDKFIADPLKPGYQEIMRVYQDITCKVIVNITLGNAKQYYRYRIAVFSGVRKFNSEYTVGARACAIMACTGDDIYSCGTRFPTYKKNSFAKFSQLTVIGTAPKRKIDPKTKTYDSTFFQSFSTSSLSSLKPEEVDYKEITKGTQTTYSLSLNNCNVELYTFGFWGRQTADDGKMETPARIKNVVESME